MAKKSANITIEITEYDNTFENNKKTIPMAEYICEATDETTNKKYECCLLGWTANGLLIKSLSTQTQYSISFEQFIRGIIKKEEENNG